MQTRPWIVVVLSVLPLPAQTFAELTTQLASATSYDEAMVGEDGDKSATFRCYEQWRQRGTIADLRAATEHENPIVRCYAVRALTERRSDVDPVDLMRARLDDTAVIETMSGCIIADRMAGDVVFDWLRPRLAPEQLQDVAELLIERGSRLDARDSVLRNLHLRDRMLHKVRSLAELGDLPALVALARYRLRPDLPLLQRALQHADPFDGNAWFLAAQEFPDASLLAGLTALESAAHRRLRTDTPTRLRHWLRAIAMQDSPDAARFLTDFFRQACRDDAGRRGQLVRTYDEMLATIDPAPALAELWRLVAAERGRDSGR